MFRIFASWLAIAALHATAVEAHLRGVLRGSVQDSRTGQAISGAVLEIHPVLTGSPTDSAWGDTIPCDSLGQFRVQLPVGPVEVQVVAPGYFRYRVPDLEVKSGTSTEYLLPLVDMSVTEISSSTVHAKANLQADPLHAGSVTRLSRDQVNNSPGSSQDVNRVLTSLPSVDYSGDDNWTSFVVRGGSSSENAFQVDGMEVNNISHWGDGYTNGGPIGILHLDFVRDLDFYAGGMHAGLVPRISSVTDIHLREGSYQERNWQTDLNMAGAGVFAEGPIDSGKASYMVSGRYSFLDLISWMFPWNGVPRYRNASAKVAWKVGNRSKILLNAMGGDEIIEMDNGNDGTLTSDGRHFIGGLEWQAWGNDWRNRSLFSGLATEYGARQQVGDLQVFDFHDRERKTQWKDELELYVGKSDILSLGTVVEQRRLDEAFTNEPYWIAWMDSSFAYVRELPIDYPDSAWRDSLGGEIRTADTMEYRIGGHASYLWKPDPWSISIGVREDYYTLLDKHGLSPRLGVVRELDGKQSISMSAALMQQYPTQFKLMKLIDDSSLGLRDVPLQRAWTGAIGWRKALSSAVRLDVEGYGKWYDREAKYQLDTEEGERKAIVDPDRYWHRKAGGLELHLQKDRKDRFFYELAYSLAFAFQEYSDGSWQVVDNNMRNMAHVILGSRFSTKYTLSGRLDVGEGRPYTPIDKERSLAEYRTVYDMSKGWNTMRRDPVLNLSVRWSENHYFKWGRIENYMEATNLLNRTWIVEESYDRGNNPLGGSISAYRSRGFFFVGGVAIVW